VARPRFLTKSKAPLVRRGPSKLPVGTLPFKHNHYRWLAHLFVCTTGIANGEAALAVTIQIKWGMPGPATLIFIVDLEI